MIAEAQIRLVNLANSREHWATRARRAKAQRGLAAMLFADLPRPQLPLIVTITRIAARKMDTDGLAISAKHVRDGIADWLRVDDGSDQITWQYAQERGKPKQYAVRVEIVEAAPKEPEYLEGCQP